MTESEPTRHLSEPEQREQLLRGLSLGYPLATILRDWRMPGREQVYDQLATDPDLLADFRTARRCSVDALAEDCLDIADETATTPLELAKQRMRINTRLKLIARWERRDARQFRSERRAPDAYHLLTDEQLDVWEEIEDDGDLSQLTQEQRDILETIPTDLLPDDLRPPRDAPHDPSVRHPGPGASNQVRDDEEEANSTPAPSPNGAPPRKPHNPAPAQPPRKPHNPVAAPPPRKPHHPVAPQARADIPPHRAPYKEPPRYPPGVPEKPG